MPGANFALKCPAVESEYFISVYMFFFILLSSEATLVTLVAIFFFLFPHGATPQEEIWDCNIGVLGGNVF